VEPETVVSHEAQEVLRRILRISASAVHAGVLAVLASSIEGKRKSGFAEIPIRLIEVFHLDAVIRVYALAAGDSKRIRAPIVIQHERNRAAGTPQNLSADARRLIELAVRLPSIDDPRLDLELFAWEDLNAHAVEEPRCVRRYIRGLIRPVVELIIAVESDVGHEDARIDVDAVQLVEVISAIGLRDVSISVVELPLPAPGTRVIARSGL